MTFIEKQHEIGEIIDGSRVIYDFDGVTRAAVYTGWLTYLTPAEPVWNISEESVEIAKICDGSPYFLTLDEIFNHGRDRTQFRCWTHIHTKACFLGSLDGFLSQTSDSDIALVEIGEILR